MVYVVGDDPLSQVIALMPESGWTRSASSVTAARHTPGAIDWAAIGGRYSGMLIPRAGATGRRFGDAPGPGDDLIGELLGDLARVSRVGARRDRTGVDQIRADEVDWDATIAQADRRPVALIVHGDWHRAIDHLSVAEMGASLVVGTGLFAQDQVPQADWKTAALKLDLWDELVLWPGIDTAIDRGDLLTVVDVHQ